MGTARHLRSMAAALLAAGCPLAASAGDSHHHGWGGWELERADASEAAILQTGEGNQVTIEQSAAAGFVQGFGSSEMNEANVIQNGDGNVADLYQKGTSNEIDLMQSGVNNEAAISQFGSQRAADVQQTGNGLSIGITQYGFGNSAPVIVRQH